MRENNRLTKDPDSTQIPTGHFERKRSFYNNGSAVIYHAHAGASQPMTVDDFRRIALSLEGAEESSHMGHPDFRIGGRIFATLAAAVQGYGNLMLSPEQQARFVEELPEVFIPITGGWGRNGATHIRLAAASEDVLKGALQTAWKMRLEKNRKSRKKKREPRPSNHNE